MVIAVLTAFALLLLFVIVLLAIPVTLVFQVSHRQTIQGHVTLLWAFGLVRVRIPLPGAKARPHKMKQAPDKHKHPRSQRESSKRSKPLVLIRYRPFRRRVFRLLADLWRAIQKQNVAFRIRLGLGDPADTGRLWGLIGPVAALLATLKTVSVDIEPEFMEAMFELDGCGTVRIVPLQIIVLVIAFFLSPHFWAGMRRMRQAG